MILVLAMVERFVGSWGLGVCRPGAGNAKRTANENEVALGGIFFRKRKR
jgi:hypothetical protein